MAYAKRVRGTKMYGCVSTHLPVRVNSAGVIPIIFALSLLLFPGMIASFFSAAEAESVAKIATAIQNLFSQTSTLYAFLYFFFVFTFTYFYTAVVFDPKEVSQNIQRAGGFIPGIRPGRPTQEYITRVLVRITWGGALFLGVVAVLPFLATRLTDVQALQISAGSTPPSAITNG